MGRGARFDGVTVNVKWKDPRSRFVVLHRVAAAGMSLVALMHALILPIAFSSPKWSAIQGLGLAGALLAFAGLVLLAKRLGLALLAAGLFLMLAGRAMVFSVPGVGYVAPSIMVSGLALAAIAAAAWAVRPSRAPASRAAVVRAGLVVTAVGAFIDMVGDISSGLPLVVLVAVGFGATGWAMVAPNVAALDAHAQWTPREKAPREKKRRADQDAAPTTGGGAE